MKSTNRKIIVCFSLLSIGAAVLSCALASISIARSQTVQDAAGSSLAVQKSFDTPQHAAEALIKAAADYDVPALLGIFGPEGKDFIDSGDPIQDKNNIAAFASKAAEKNTISMDPDKRSRAILLIGNDDWPFPVPIVKKKGKWFFNTQEGHDEILFRRIGANELDAIKICRGFVEAQKEYALEAHDDSGINQYAQKFVSSPGKKDGLYWENADGTPGGPITKAIARLIEEGYAATKAPDYHGYYFKILKGQGPAAPMGRLDYVIKGMMIGGFALVAVPAEYRVTGVKTFMVSHDGIVYQKDLGPESLNIVKTMELYNPDETWEKTDDQWPENDQVHEK